MTDDDPPEGVLVVPLEVRFDRDTETVAVYLAGSLFALHGLVGSTEDGEQ